MGPWKCGASCWAQGIPAGKKNASLLPFTTHYAKTFKRRRAPVGETLPTPTNAFAADSGLLTIFRYAQVSHQGFRHEAAEGRGTGSRDAERPRREHPGYRPECSVEEAMSRCRLRDLPSSLSRSPLHPLHCADTTMSRQHLHHPKMTIPDTIRMPSITMPGSHGVVDSFKRIRKGTCTKPSLLVAPTRLAYDHAMY